MRTLLTGFLCVLAAPVVAASPFGGAFLDTGLGARAAGMGGAVSGAVDGAAMLYNPAGLAARRGRSLLVSYQPLSLDRSRASLAGSMNVRGPLAFGLAWLHAGVDGLVARNGSGEVLEGGIDDAEDAVFFALGINATPRLQLGRGVKIIDHRIEAPQAGESRASGRAVDLGLRYRLGDNTVIGIAARNLLDKLSWSVIRPSAQTSSSDEALMSVLALGVAHDWRGVVNAAFDVEWLDVGGERNLRAHGGIEAPLNDLLTIRGGVQRMGDADGFGLPAFGVTMRPMRMETVQIHYAWATDDIDAGGRTVLTLSSLF